MIDYYVERARKSKAEADALERKSRITDGEYMPLSEIKSDISNSVGICANILNGFKTSIARIAPEMPNRALEQVVKETAKCLTALIELDESYANKCSNKAA